MMYYFEIRINDTGECMTGYPHGDVNRVLRKARAVLLSHGGVGDVYIGCIKEGERV